MTEDLTRLLEKISKACEVCNEYIVSPFRFRATIPEQNIIFNRLIAIDIMWIIGKPVVHIAGVEKNFQNAILISGKTSK